MYDSMLYGFSKRFTDYGCAASREGFGVVLEDWNGLRMF